MNQPSQTSPMLTIPEIIQLVDQRANFYAMLAHLYQEEINQDTYQSLTKIAWGNFTAVPALSVGAMKIQEFLNEPPPDMLIQLAADYAQTFLDGVTITGAYPYESVYTSDDHLLMQAARDSVLEIYQQEELAVITERTEFEDHIAFELEMMQHYTKKTKAALESKNYALAVQLLHKQKFFLVNHLLNWTPTFCDDVARIAQTDFYKGLAILTDAFLNLETETITGLSTELEFVDQA